MPNPAPPPTLSDASAERIRAARAFTRNTAWLLDSSIRIPIIGVRFGIAPLIGLFPVLGDLIAFFMTLTLIVHAVRLKAPPRLLLRMTGNAVLDLFIGLVPVVGDIADFVFKANRRNAVLLERHLDQLEGKPPPSPWRRRLAVLLVVVILAIAAWGAWQLGAWLIGQLAVGL